MSHELISNPFFKCNNTPLISDDQVLTADITTYTTNPIRIMLSTQQVENGPACPTLLAGIDCADDLPLLAVQLGGDSIGNVVWGKSTRNRLLGKEIFDTDTIDSSEADVFIYKTLTSAQFTLLTPMVCQPTDIYIRDTSNTGCLNSVASADLIDGQPFICIPERLHLWWDGLTWWTI